MVQTEYMGAPVFEAEVLYSVLALIGGFLFYRGLWGIMEKKMETTIIGFRDLGFRVWGLGFRV